MALTQMPKVGDKVRFVGDARYYTDLLTPDAVYEVDRLDEYGDALIVADDGDRMDITAEVDFEHFELVSEGADNMTKPTTRAEYWADKRATYTAEQRQARKGERIVIVEPNVHDSENYERGDIFRVDKVDSAGVTTTTGNIVYHEEYEVLPEVIHSPDYGLTLDEILAQVTDDSRHTVPDKPAQIRAACDELRDLLIRKNHDYGDSFAKQYEKYGLMSALIRMDDKMRRLETLVDGQQAQVAESIEDTLADLAGYALLALVEARAGR